LGDRGVDGASESWPALKAGLAFRGMLLVGSGMPVPARR
jgi:hypothetical protein